MFGIGLCAFSIVVGGISGIVMGKKVSKEFQDYMLLLIGLICFSISFLFISKAADLLSVTIALFLGGGIGFFTNLDNRIFFGISKIGGCLTGNKDASGQETEISALIAIIFASSTGIVGTINAGLSGNIDMLLIKAVLDFPVACIFAVSLGYFVCFMAVPEIIFYIMLFFVSGWLGPHLTEECIANLNACGGILILTSAIKLFKMGNFPTMNLLPVLILIIPVTLLRY